MSPEQFVAIMGALTLLIGAIVQLLVAVRSLHSAVNGRLTMLLDEATTAARKDGELAGRDFMQRLSTASGRGHWLDKDLPPPTP
jgi:hypothetical protein